jgi:hypothetical protein
MSADLVTPEKVRDLAAQIDAMRVAIRDDQFRMDAGQEPLVNSKHRVFSGLCMSLLSGCIASMAHILRERGIWTDEEAKAFSIAAISKGGVVMTEADHMAIVKLMSQAAVEALLNGAVAPKPTQVVQ